MQMFLVMERQTSHMDTRNVNSAFLFEWGGKNAVLSSSATLPSKLEYGRDADAIAAGIDKTMVSRLACRHFRTLPSSYDLDFRLVTS